MFAGLRCFGIVAVVLAFAVCGLTGPCGAQSEPARPAESSATVKPNEGAQPTQAIEPAKPGEPGEATKPAKASEADKPGEPGEATKPAEPADEAEKKPTVIDLVLPSGKESPVPVKTEKIDETARKIGEEIDRMEDKASSTLGGWVKTRVVFGISWIKLIFCMVLVLLVVLVQRIVQAWIQGKLRVPEAEGREATWGELVLRACSAPLALFVWVYGIYAALSPLFEHFRRPDGVNWVRTVAAKSADIGGTIALIWFIYRLVHVLDARLRSWAARTESTLDVMLVPLVAKMLRVFVLLVGAILLVQNITGIEVGPLIASLGIGGLALALAAKESVSNFFGTLTILFTKPFQVGDRIVMDGCDGVVESVGFRSTQVRALTGHLVTVPNQNIITSTLENIGRRPSIRWYTDLTITYDTPPDKVERAVEILREILDNHEGMKQDFPPRVHFNGFNDWSLNISIFAWYHPPNYWDYQDWLQRTCLEILRRFEAEGIEFAFPTRTLFLANDDRRQLKLQMLRGENAGSEGTKRLPDRA